MGGKVVLFVCVVSQKGKSKSYVLLWLRGWCIFDNILNGKSVQQWPQQSSRSQYLWLSFFVCRLVKRLLVNGPCYAACIIQKRAFCAAAGGCGNIILCALRIYKIYPRVEVKNLYIYICECTLTYIHRERLIYFCAAVSERRTMKLFIHFALMLHDAPAL